MLESFVGNKFEYQRLTEDEQKRRGILGRLVGIIADTKNPTRNGRHYSAKLWENVFKNNVMREKIKNRVCFGELDHPADREEIDTSKIAVCLAEMPKMGSDGNLYGVFDILSTPNGKILKTLCDYGSTVGISSRGSGDIIDEDEVDPDTYDCVGFDIVLVPAVETARLRYVCESLDTKTQKTMKQALTEDINKSEEEDKKIMLETLNNLGMHLLEDIENIDDLEYAEHDDENKEDMPLMEEDSDEEEISEEEVEEEEIPDEEPIEELPEDEELPEEEDQDLELADTVEEFISQLAEYDKDKLIAFAPIVIEDKEYTVQSITIDDEQDEDAIIININCSSPEDEEEIEEIDSEAEEETDDIDDSEELDDATDEADDAGLDEVLESLKDLVRKNEALEKENTDLKKSKAADDARAEELVKSVKKYKESFERTSMLASKVPGLNKQVKELQESLSNEKDKTSELNKSLEKAKALKESLSEKSDKEKLLEGKLASAELKYDSLTDSYNSCKKKLTESAKIIDNYKAKFSTVLNHYISYRAEALGVSPKEITNRLNENYTLSDIDNICDELLTSGTNYSSLPFATKRIKMVENKQPESRATGYGSDEDLNDLLELAGLKKSY